jgi:Holliday junction resolvase-like predicted endonuclease
MSKKDQDNTEEPLSEYGEPLSFKQVWKMFQETDKMFKETEKRFRDTEKRFRDTEKRFKETDKKMQETDRKIDKLAKLYGNVSENSKDVAEEFFKRGLEAKGSIFGIEYEEVDHLERISKKQQGEFDIVLHNGKYVVVMEVKYKLHPDDVTDFVNRKLPKFTKLFHEYADKTLLGAVAGMSVPTVSYDLAEKYGLLVLTQSGENITVMNPEGFELIRF